MKRLNLTKDDLKRIISESVKVYMNEASQKDIASWDNTNNILAARDSIAKYVKQITVEYSLSNEDVRYIMKTLNNYIQSNDSFL